MMPVRANADTVRSATPFFPACEDDTNDGEETPIERPQDVGPVFDEAHASQPIAAWDDGYHQENYTEALREDASAEAPAQPTEFKDPYLFPMLAKNERQRLTMLWYYTRNIQQDPKLMQRLNDKIKLVKEFMGWEFAIVGIISNNNYIRIATSGLPLAILPRRESTCSHTINQQSGSVFWLEDMTKDWRFKESPHVATAGLRSYAGTQLRFRTSTGDDVALGSLCIASNEASEPFSEDRKTALIRFAAMFTDEIINGARQARHKSRQQMTELIIQISARSGEPDIEQVVIDTVQTIYPTARVGIQSSASGLINVRGREPFSYNKIPDGIWEDSDYLEHLIVTQNHEDLAATQSVRAIVGKSAQLPIPRYLVVDSMEVELVFDDIDAWFIERSALTLCNILQRRFLEEALKAKETFLRGITHQLRTPIHGVLASADLLAEELAARDTLLGYAPVDRDKYASSKDNADSILSTINSSGKELLATVNGILKLNRWAGLNQGPHKSESYKLADLEQDLCRDMSEAFALSHHEEVTIFFDNRLEPPMPIKTDPELLRECLSALAQNAMSYTEKGYINITLSQSADNTFIVDIIDTGNGVKDEDQKRIFEACERANTSIRGAGLGLTLASKIATRMNGSIDLVSSTPNSGSHFRASLPALIETSPACEAAESSVVKHLKYLPKIWYRLQVEGEQSPVTIPLSKFLEARGISQDHVMQDSLVFIDYTEDAKALDKMLCSVDKLLLSVGKTQARLCLVPAGKSSEHLAEVATKHNVTLCSGPFTTARMDTLLKRVDSLYCDMSKSKSQSTEQTPATTSQRASDVSHLGSTKQRPSISLPILPKKKDPERFYESKPCALLVDDNSINLHILKVYCEKRGIPYATATDGNQAVEAFTSSQNQEPFNLVLMDLQMPECDGIQATKQIRDIERKASVYSNRKTAVIFMVTGQDSTEDRRRSEAAGCDAYYVKPVGIKTLDQAIKTYFRNFTPGAKKSAAAPRCGSASSEGSNHSASTVAPSSLDGAVDDEPAIAGQRRGRMLQVDSKSSGRDDSLHREVRRASESCHPRSEAVLTTSPTSPMSKTSGLQTLMDEGRRVVEEAVE